ncbi:MAG: methylamine utilization MauE [Desulfomicrobium sp.]|nr:methylamine utilization MauE [Pseudomonadota bacterium]MBV1711898.1 methylamine utilization MauE [Desulfomicrobium sp.]MBU4571075.1 methylamine utilization MauE [Pseudomonadota bacterium]MBU4593704.1 methylamine utilization MauE [Pseudomonadota bacterium]MBV1719040.1 methylamine utilization MauE [Desulfomicrobium sp.]
MNAASLSRSLRLALALIFVAAAPQKILAPDDFAVSVASYLILPDVLVNFTALTLPWLEMIVAILLVCRAWTGPALLLANAMLLAFLAAVTSAYVRGIDLNCGCFSSAPTASEDMVFYIVRDVVFVALGLTAAWLHSRGYDTD